MLFYHYSKDKYDVLKSLSSQQGSMPKTIRSYGNSISLFLEPLPINVAEIFNNTHAFYRSGLDLWEHIIDSNAIPMDIEFTLTESPEKTALLYGSQKWYDGMSDELIAANKEEIRIMELDKGYVGTGRLAMVKACKSIRVDNETAFKKASKLAIKFPEDKISEKYAACVPHLMIYPCMKDLRVKSTKQITLK